MMSSPQPCYPQFASLLAGAFSARHPPGQEGVTVARDMHDGYHELTVSPSSAWHTGVWGTMPRHCTHHARGDDEGARARQYVIIWAV